MFKNISYRRKLKALWIAALLLLFVCYRFSISKTIDEYRSYNKNLDLAVTGNDGSSPDNLFLKNKSFDEVLERFSLDTLDNARNLMDVISGLCTQHNIILKEYKPAPANQADSLKILTRAITLEGGFTDCLQAIYHLETQARTGRVSSVLFKSYTNPGDTITKLNCTIYVQNIIP